MDQKQVNKSNASSQESQNLNDGNGSSEVVAVDALNPVAPKVKQTGDIFKLDIDCFEESFDYLPFEDLVNVGKTCKRLQQVAGYCFQQNYSNSAIFSSNGIQSNGVDVKHFMPFIRNIWTNVDGLWYVLDVRSQLRQLTQITIYRMKQVHMNRLKDIPMPKLEVLRIDDCELGENFHEIIEHCPKLKRLEIECCKGSFNWLNRKFPTLEYFKYNSYEDQSIEGIPLFLEHNPNIRKFTITGQLLWENRDKFMSANIKLNDLAINDFTDNKDEFKSVCNFLNALHERDFYKKLQLYFSDIKNQEQFNQLAEVRGLMKLYLGVDTIRDFTFPALKSLLELFLHYHSMVVDWEGLPNNLTNLRRIHFVDTDIDAIMLFIRQSVELQEIKVDCLFGGVHFNEDTKVINLLALNREREQLPDAQKITLYVDEAIYLPTKWAMKGNDFGLIRLKRNKSYGWGQDFIF